MRRVLPVFLLISFALAAFAQAPASQDPRLKGAYTFKDGGWTYVHLEGTPEQIGFQHGYLLKPEIEAGFEAVKLRDTHDAQRGWNWFRQAAHEMLWPHVDPEYQAEMKGISEGLAARGSKLDLDDVIALNGMEELADYYAPWLDKQENRSSAPALKAPGNCSAFVATGSYTKDHQIVIAHNNWTSYLTGEHWTVIFDIVPAKGNRILMDGFPGNITSNDDFGVNSAGIMIAETTITGFEGYDPKGIPEFVRSRKAMQYANSIDDYVRIMKKGNNGGYANDWLIGDRKTGEIAYLELGLKNVQLWRTKDGYFISSNFARDPKLLKEEAPSFDPNDATTSPNARKARWEQLMKENRGKIDVEMAEQFLGDHQDVVENKSQADERTLCGHTENSSRGIKDWAWGPYYPGGAVQGKATDSTMAQTMSLVARAGHPCGEDFHADEFIKAHPDYKWMQGPLTDMKAGPWTTFRSDEPPK